MSFHSLFASSSLSFLWCLARGKGGEETIREEA